MIESLIKRRKREDSEYIEMRKAAMKRRIDALMEEYRCDMPNVETNDVELGLSLPPTFMPYGMRFGQAARRKTDSANSDDNKIIEHGFGNKTPEEIYEIFREYSGDNYLDKLRGRITDEKKDEIIEFARERGLIFSRDEYLKVTKIAHAVRDALKKQDELMEETKKAWEHRHTLFGHMALNNFDYKELTNEVKLLKQLISPKMVELKCEMLSKVIKETEKTKHNSYPGRHLEFLQLEGSRLEAYKRLRVLDELFYVGNGESDDDTWTDLELAKEVGKRLNKRREDRPAPPTLRKDMSTLNDLIMVDHTGKERTKRVKLGAFDERFTKKGHVYRKITNSSKRVTAFMLTLNIDETLKIESEIKSVKERFFKHQISDFKLFFPLLDLMSNFSDISLDLSNDQYVPLLNQLSNSNSVTVNYLRPKIDTLASFVEEVLNKSNYLAIKQFRNQEDKWEVVQPLEEMSGHHFKAKSLDSGKESYYNIGDVKDFFIVDKRNVLIDKYSKTLKKSDISHDILWQITLLVDDEWPNGNADWCKKLSPKINFRKYRVSNDRFATEIVIKAFINDALLDVICKLDEAGILYDIQPLRVKTEYMNYRDAKGTLFPTHLMCEDYEYVLNDSSTMAE